MAALRASSQNNVEIIGGEKLSFDKPKSQWTIVKNVVIKHDGVFIQCDSAIRKMSEGMIEGFGHIYIYQPDTFTLSGGEYLKYDEKTKTAIVTGKNVVLNDKEMTLLTTSLQYNTQNQMGYYTNGADILSDSNTLRSQKGYYDRRANVFHFKDRVKITGKDFTMEGDTLDYYAGNKTAYFFGPTRITSQENVIVCNYGWYNTAEEYAQFSRGATIFSDSTTLNADSLQYDKKKGLGRGMGNIRMYDSGEHIAVYGQYGLYRQKSKETTVSGEPVAIKADKDDTMYLLADTFYYVGDSLHRLLKAYHHASIMQKEFQAKCDSLLYNFKDSFIALFKSPIMWNQKNQVTGDTMFINLQNHKIKSMNVREGAFLASEVRPRYYNQISGKYMNNMFDSNKLKTVLVEGNARSIYYLRDNETDSAEYTGVNNVACTKMLISLDSSKVRGIRFYGQPEGKIYPVNQFPDAEKFLDGLDWKLEQKPVLESFIERTKRKERILVPQAPEAAPAKSKKKKRKTKV